MVRFNLEPVIRQIARLKMFDQTPDQCAERIALPTAARSRVYDNGLRSRRMSYRSAQSPTFQSGSVIQGEIEKYLRTGDSDPLYAAWGGSFMERANRAHSDLRGSLVREVRRLAMSLKQHPMLECDTVALTRSKVEPMVRGLFRRAEQETVLGRLERSVVFLTSANIECILFDQSFDHSAWALANLYLASVGSELLGEGAPRLVGISEETTCFVSAEYFASDDLFADFIVHEAAHIFHNCKRSTLGLCETRRKQWLLDIDYSKREMFAYACEAYSCILRQGKSPADRRALAAEYAQEKRTSDERVDTAELAGIIQAASAARNGWKVILSLCTRV